MERVKNEKHKKQVLNRTISYVALVISIFMLGFVISKTIDYIKLSAENKKLKEILIEFELEKERLELENAKLTDSNYKTYYIQGKYLYDGENLIKITPD